MDVSACQMGDDVDQGELKLPFWFNPRSIMTQEATIPLFTDPAQARQRVLDRHGGEPSELPPSVQASIRRVFGTDLTPDEVTARILADVRQRGDEAVLEYTRRIDGVELEQLAVTREEIEAAWAATPSELRQALRLAMERVRDFHRRQPLSSWMDWREDGGALGQMVRPLERVGVYVPGGRAPYPSSLIMAVVPAQVAGVREIFVASPPRRDGTVAPAILAAAKVAGVDRVFKVGGAQAIAALAYGTESIPRVDKIVGPGNIFVIAAKRQVFGEVGIDQLPGPTETMLIADEGANPTWVAADLLAQAEHDPLASAILLTPSLDLAQEVQAEVERQMQKLSRREIIAQSLTSRGGIIVVKDLEEAVRLANEYAPEHLCLLTKDPWALVGRIENAGGIFVGEYASEALGDYVVGPSHIMPTRGTARFSSPLNVWDFVKITSIFAPSPAESQRLTRAGIALAEAEGFTAHAEAIRRRVRRTATSNQSSVLSCNSAADCGLWTTDRGPVTLIRPDIAEMPEYTPVLPFEVLSRRLGRRPEEIIKLDGNENPYGPSPKVYQALADYRLYHIYPDPSHTLLREAIESYLGVERERILCGAGSDELLDLIMRLFLRPGDGIINCPPTFGMYAFDAGLHGAETVTVWRGEDFTIDVEGIVRALDGASNCRRVKLLFLNSPNNPDGGLITEGELRRLLELPLVVVLDEAYAEFSGVSHIGLTREYDNLIVLRTFSKWAGLAGLRVGYGIFPKALMPHLWKIKQPYNVNVAAQVAALASLADLEYLQSNVQRIIAERERLFAELQAIEYLHPYPSQANFILCRVIGRDAYELKRALEREGILIRYFRQRGLEDCIRISVGRPEQTDALLTVLRGK